MKERKKVFGFEKQIYFERFDNFHEEKNLKEDKIIRI